MKHHPISRRPARLCLLFAALPAAIPAIAAERTWDAGAVVGFDWSKNNNWDPNTVPSNGDSLVFPDPGVFFASGHISHNDLPAGRWYRSIEIFAEPGSFSGEGYELTGNAIELRPDPGSFGRPTALFVQNGTNNATGQTIRSSFNLDVTLGADCHFVQSGRTDLQGTVNLAGRVLSFGQNSVAGYWDCTGGFSGPGELIVAGSMILRNNSGFTGQVTVSGGPVWATQVETFGSTAGPTVLDGSIYLQLAYDPGAGRARVLESTDQGLFLQPAAISEPFIGRLGRILADAGAPQTLSGDFETQFFKTPLNTGGGFEQTIGYSIIEARRNSLTLTGSLHGDGRMHISGPHPVRIGGSSSNAQTSLVAVGTTGVLELDKQGGPALSGPVEVADGGVLRTLRSGQIGGLQTVDFGRGAAFELNGATTSMRTLHLDGASVTGGGVLEVQEYVMANAALVEGDGYGCNLDASLRITSATPEFFIRNNFGTVIGTGSISVAPGSPATTLRLIKGADSEYGSARGDLHWTGAINGLQLVHVESGLFRYSGAAFGVDVTLAGGHFTGQSATLRDLTDASGGEVRADGGSVSVRNLTLNGASTFYRDVSTIAANDTFVASANVQLAGARLALRSITAPASAIGTRRIIIQKNSAGPVTGVFKYPPDVNGGAVIPEGGIVSDENHQWRLSYSGVDGNDVTLTLIGILPTGETRQWTGGGAGSSWSFSANWANPLPKPGDALRFPSVADRLCTHNFTSGTIYSNIQVTADSYRFAGNPLALMGGINVNYPSGNADFEHSIVLGAAQTFTARQSARLRLSLTNDGGVDLNGFSLTLNAVNNGSVIDVGNASAGSDPASALTGTGIVTKSGPGLVNFNAASDFTGPLTVSSGTARVTRSSAALGSAAVNSGTSVNGVSSRLELLLPGSIPEPMNLQSGNLQVNPGAAQSLTTTGAFSSSGGTLEVTQGQFDVSAALTGSSLRKTGAGTLRLTPASAPALSGSLTVDGGLVIFASSSSPNMAGPVTLNNTGTTLRLDAANQLGGPVTMNSGTALDLNGQSDTIPSLTLTDAAIITGAGTLTSPQISTSGLTGNTISGKLAIPAGGTVLDVLNDDAATDLAVSAIISGAALTKNGEGTAMLSGNNTFTSAAINEGALIFTGTNAAAITLNGGMIGGSGSVGALTSGAAGGMVSPGTSTGILSSGSVAWNAATTFAVELNSTTPGTGHDQLNVTGTVNLGGATLLALPGSGAAGTMTIIANDGTDAVTGTFASLPENATFAVAGKTFRISYTGGTGNDVTLTVIVTGTGVTKTWSGLGANNQWPTAANWVGGIAPVAGDDLVFPAGPFVKTCNNTFPAGTTFNSIRITDSGYGLAGNGISLNAGIVFDYATNVSSVAMDVTLAGPWSVTVLQGAQGIIIPNTALATAGFPLTAQVDGAAARLTLNLLSGTGALVKTGIGGLTMNVNNWTGPVTLSGGETKTGTLSGFGTGTSAIVVQSGAELRFENIAGGTFTRPLSLSGKLEFSASPITLSGAISLPSSGQRTVEVTGGTPALTGVISGSGGLRKSGPGLLTLSGAGTNTFTGGCTVAESTLRLGKSGVALPGPVTIGDGAGSDVLFYLAANQISDAATVDLLGSGSVMQCGTFSDTIGVLRFTGGIVSGSGTLSVGEQLRSFAATTTATVDISFMPLVSPFMVDVEDGAAALDLTISGDWLGAAALDADRTGDGTFSLRSGTMRTLKLSEGTTLVTGLFSPEAILLAGGTLGGDGITTAVGTESGKKGGISPGASPGQLTVSTWTGDENTELTMEIGGLDPGTQHDQLIVSGMADPKDAMLTLVPLAGYTPQPGQSFTLIQNNGPDRMASEFFKLPEGATFDFAGTTARITYSGGDGNDVAIAILYITDTGVTRIWDGGGANGNWTTPENWDDDTAPVPGDSLSFPSAAARKTNTNNFPAGTNFHRIGIGDAYTISGNLIALNDGVHRQDGTSANVTTITAPLIATRAQTFSNALPPPSPSATTILVVESLNTAGFPITMDTRSHADISLNNVSGTGSLAVTGSGRLLPAVITMTGALSIQGTSVVLLNGTLGATSSVSIASGAILGVSPFSPVTITQPISLSGIIAATDTTFTGTITLPTGAKGRFNANAGETATISGRIQGAGKLATMGDGTIRFTGAVANTFTGGLEHGGALLMLSKTAGITALPGPVEGTGNGEIRWLGANQAADTAVFTRVRTLNLNNSSDTFARLVLGNTDVTTGAGTLTLTLTGDISSQFAASDTATISGKLAFTGAGPHLLELSDTSAAAELTSSAVITTGPGVLLRKTGTGTATFTGANATAVEIAAGKVNWNGNAPATSITMTGGTLNGTGTTGPVSAGGGGTVSPGLSPGKLHTGNLTWDSTLTYAPELLTTIPGTGHDQLLATGTVSLGGAILATSLLPGFAATPGDTFLLIANDGIDSVSGTFSGLPEGAHFFSEAQLFRISYTGGDGNDVVLTKVEETEPGITAHSFPPGVGAESGQTVINVTATGLTSLNYVMESSTDLEAWTPLQSLPASPGGTITFRALKPDTFPRLFLRVSRE